VKADPITGLTACGFFTALLELLSPDEADVF